MQVRCELRREQPEPLSWAPPHPGAPAPTPPHWALPAAPSAAQSTSARGALSRAATPIPGRPLNDPFPMSWSPFSAPLAPLCGTRSLQDCQPASPPHRETGSPNTEAVVGRTETPQIPSRLLSLLSLPLLLFSLFPNPPASLCLLIFLCLSLPPASPRGYLLVSNPHPPSLLCLLPAPPPSPQPPNPMSPSCFSFLLPVSLCLQLLSLPASPPPPLLPLLFLLLLSLPSSPLPPPPPSLLSLGVI